MAKVNSTHGPSFQCILDLVPKRKANDEPKMSLSAHQLSLPLPCPALPAHLLTAPQTGRGLSLHLNGRYGAPRLTRHPGCSLAQAGSGCCRGRTQTHLDGKPQRGAIVFIDVINHQLFAFCCTSPPCSPSSQVVPRAPCCHPPRNDPLPPPPGP